MIESTLSSSICITVLYFIIITKEKKIERNKEVNEKGG